MKQKTQETQEFFANVEKVRAWLSEMSGIFGEVCEQRAFQFTYRSNTKMPSFMCGKANNEWGIFFMQKDGFWELITSAKVTVMLDFASGFDDFKKSFFNAYKKHCQRMEEALEHIEKKTAHAELEEALLGYSETQTTKDTERGLYGKYRVYKTDSDEEVKTALFVLDERDPVALYALIEYAMKTPDTNLARNIYNQIHTILNNESYKAEFGEKVKWAHDVKWADDKPGFYSLNIRLSSLLTKIQYHEETNA